MATPLVPSHPIVGCVETVHAAVEDVAEVGASTEESSPHAASGSASVAARTKGVRRRFMPS